jgi:glycosyltransferase involved in cell wall biosynthesis
MRKLDRPLRVLFAIGSLRGGGSEHQLSRLVTHVKAEGIEPIVGLAVDDPKAQLRPAVEAARIPIHTIGPVCARRRIRPFITLCRWHRVVRETKPDVIYAWLEESSMYLVPIARFMGIPAAVSRRNVSGSRAEHRRVVRAAVYHAERRADLVTCNSEAVLTAATERGISPARLRLVRNAHALPPVGEPDGCEPVRIGYVARFREEKGHGRLLEVLARLDTARSWSVTLAGDGALVDAVRSEVARRRLQERVQFAGLVTDMDRFWATHHIAALFSDHEGSPNALIEAALAGRPIVATAVGGSPEVCDHAGMLTHQPTDIAGLATSLSALIEDPALLRARGHAARRSAAQRYSLQGSIAGHVAALLEAATRD